MGLTREKNMLNFDSDLQATLATATSKLDWCNKLVAALGSGLKIRCKRSADSSSTTVFTSGAEFYNASIVGAPVTNAGSIVKFGNVINSTIQSQADLSSGASVLRIEGATHWMEGTLGLPNSSADFKVPQSPTAKTGIAFSNIQIAAPRGLPSGVGSVAVTSLPATGTPATIELENWVNPSNHFMVKRISLDTRAPDFVYQDTEMATEMGDIRVTQSSESIIYGQFEFGVTMFTIQGSLNLDNPGTPVHQIVIAHKPYGTWPSYPMADTFRPDRDRTHSDPFKIIVRDANGTILKTFEMRDGLAINDKTLAQRWGRGVTTPLRPHLHCGQWLFWQSDRLKYSSNASKYFPGVTSQSLRPSLAKNGVSSNASIPLELNADQWNSTLQFYAAPEWGIWFTDTSTDSQATLDAADALDTFEDPYLFNTKTYHGYEGHTSRISGWNVEPGSISLHDWFAGPGGPRHDRTPLNTPLVRYFSDPTGHRLKGNVPHRTMLDCYNAGYFHHGHHMMLPDVKTFKLLPKEFARDGTISFMNAYYGQGPFMPMNRTIDLRGLQNGGTRPTPTRDGHPGFWNYWALDDNHSYVSPGMAAIFCNSPAHAVSGMLRLYAHVAAQLGSAHPESTVGTTFMSRVHAWRMLQLAVAWKIASTSVMSIDRETIEQRFQRELESVYDNVYVPAIINQSTDPTMMGIRRFGQYTTIEYGNSANGMAGLKWLRGWTDSKAGYFNGVLSLMRQTGCWAAMRARSNKCDVALRFLVDCMDKDSLMSLYYTNGRYEANFVYSDRVPTSGSVALDATNNQPDPPMYADWIEWVAKNPPVGQEGIMTDVNGNPVIGSMGATNGLRLQWAFVRRDYFPEIPSPMDGTTSIVTAVCAKAQGWLDAFEAKINAISTPASQGGNDLPYYYPPHGVYKAPSTLGPF